MENLINHNVLEKNKKILVPSIFTHIQYNILKNKLHKKKLNLNEKTYFYTYIKPKIKAAALLLNIQEFNVQGEEFIENERLNLAKKILNQLEKKHRKQKIMISGSFLFNKTYQDIDVFIFSKYKKEDYRKGKLHVTFLPLESINSLFFNSISKISVSNFEFIKKTKFEVNIEDILQKYELLINMINYEYPEKELRDFILEIEYFSKETILNPRDLHVLKNKLKRKNSEIISNMLINSVILNLDVKIKKVLKEKIGDYKKLLKEYPKSSNLKEYINTYTKVIEFESRRSKNKNTEDIKYTHTV